MEKYQYWCYNTRTGFIVEIASEDLATHMAMHNLDYILFTANLFPEDKYPYKSGRHTRLGPECFTDGGIVISYKGVNYYRECGKHVRDLPDGGASHCVMRYGHPSNQHEDMDGNVRYG